MSLPLIKETCKVSQLQTGGGGIRVKVPLWKHDNAPSPFRYPHHPRTYSFAGQFLLDTPICFLFLTFPMVKKLTRESQIRILRKKNEDFYICSFLLLSTGVNEKYPSHYWNGSQRTSATLVKPSSFSVSK